MVAIGSHARRWGAYVAVGVALGLGQACAAQPPHPRISAQATSDPSGKSPSDNPDPSRSSPLEGDAQRIAGALEAKNRYDQSPQGQQDAHKAADSAADAAGWAEGMFWVAIVETAVTLAGVVLVYLTLREVKITADETRNAATAAKDALAHARSSAQQELRAYISLERIDFRWTDNHAAVVEVTWRNTGETPIRRALAQLNMRIEDDEITEDFDFADKPPDTPDPIHIGPGQMRTIHTPEKVHEVDIGAVASKRRHINIWGWIEYNDVFKGTARHRTEFSSVLRILGSKVGTPTYVWESFGPMNGADEDCHHKPTT